jgi:serine/threonine-protein kinase
MATIGVEDWVRLRALLDQAMDLGVEERRAFVESFHFDAPLHAQLALLVHRAETLAETPLSNAMELVAPAFIDDETLLDSSRVGERIGRYTLVRLLGAGGMGAVYLAERTADGFTQRVALKLVRHALLSAKARKRFDRERQILAALKYHGIALLFDGGETDEGLAYYTMEYVEGVSITEYCRDERLDTQGCVALLVQVANALAYAHQNLVVHRDIKPSNVLVTRDGRTKLVDFGLAKPLDRQLDALATQAEIRPMTPAYAAPEQFRNENITVATDVYQFGVLCFAVLSRRLPYRADPADAIEWARAVTEDEPMRLAHAARLQASAESRKSERLGRLLTSDLDAIVRKALAKRPADRYRSMDAMIADLEAFLAGKTVRARKAGPFYFVWRFAHRWRYAVVPMIVIAVLALLIALIADRSIGYWVHRHDAELDAARTANTKADFFLKLLVSSNDTKTGTTEKSIDDAVAHLDAQSGLTQPERARELSWLGEAYLAQGDLAKARTVLSEAVASLRRDDAGDAYHLGHALQLLGMTSESERDFAGARDAFTSAQLAFARSGYVAARRDSADMHARLGAIWACLGNAQEARAEFEAAAVSMKTQRARETSIAAANARLQQLASGDRTECNRWQ